ncbi:MAG: DNA cytosine methyltransferase [Acidobacteriota bacterium]|nr:DNA cytosine methyltransferase [Acidobacteriota bacterium]
MRSLELFTGAGGLALGVAQAGFSHLAVVERDEDACATLFENSRRGVEGTGHWPIHQQDIQEFDYSAIPEGIELIAAGVPCQPFSIGGKHKGHLDERNLFPQTIEVIRRIKPLAVLIENVRGLLRPSFSKYFGYIELMLTYPEICRKGAEPWIDHLGRLERYHTRGKRDGLYYRVVHRPLNAADYGVPQRRERLFMVALRSDLGIEWSFPPPTHSPDSLLWEQYCSQEYWQRHSVPRKRVPPARPDVVERIQKLKDRLIPPALAPWKTVRDAISDLPMARKRRSVDEPGLTHFSINGARSYVGHTGSPLDEPAKTLKAGVHGVPGGENMLALPGGGVRYFTIRESARLQTFPDSFVFPNSWTESMRQIGNAVPVELAAIIAKRLKETLSRKASVPS